MTSTRAKNAKRSTANPGEQLYLELIQTHDLLNAAIAGLFQDSGLTQQQYNVLRILRGAGPGGLPTLEIRDRMITRVPDVTRLIDRLEGAELVRRLRSDEDRRVVRIEIAAPGLALLDSLDAPLRALHAEHVAHLSERDVASLTKLLSKLRDPLKDD